MVVAEIAAVSGMLSALQSAAKITQGLLKMGETARIQEKVIELNGEILTAQQSAFAAQATQTSLLERISDLEKEVARHEEWEAEKKHYHLQQVYPGALAYVLKPDTDTAEPPHWLCTNCYEHGKKSLLQRRNSDRRRIAIFLCSPCKNEIEVGWKTRPDQPYEPEG
jgi:hypothetical protein